MKIKFWVIDESSRGGKTVHTADSEEDAIEWIEKHTPADLMGTVYYSIKKVYTSG